MPDRLLYALSTRGKMNFDNFDAAFTAIYPKVYKKFPEDISPKYLSRTTMRSLDALGHCDFDYEKRYIYTCQPAFILVPSFGLPKALLIGGRDQNLVVRIRKFAAENKNSVKFYAIPQRIQYSLLPQAIYLEVINKDLLEESALKIGISSIIDEPAAWWLISFSSDVSEIDKKSSFELREEPNWPKRIFSVRDLFFDKYYIEKDEIRLIEYTNPRDQQRLHWIWHDDKASEVDRDWGRFLVLHKQSKNAILYDIKRFLLAVPVTVPLPRLMARALTLCTGLAPSEAVLQNQPIETIPENYRLNIYEAVVPSIAEVVSSKLGQTLIDYNLEIEEGKIK